MGASRLSHYIDVFLPLKIVFKRKKQKKRKPFNQGGQAKKPKGNGISPEGWRSHYAVVIWLASAVGVRLNFAAFLFFFEIRFRPLTPNATSHCNINIPAYLPD